jgi:hypothetical protein
MALLLGLAGVLVAAAGFVYHHCDCQFSHNFVAGSEKEFEAFNSNVATTLVGIAIAVFLVTEQMSVGSNTVVGHSHSSVAVASLRLKSGLTDGRSCVTTYTILVIQGSMYE